MLKSNWSIGSDDDYSRQSFLSDCDSEFDFSLPPQSPTEKHFSAILNKLSINRTEPVLTRSRANVESKPYKSTIRCSMDSITDMETSSIDSPLFSKEETPTSPTDRVNKLADWFESCSLDESKRKMMY